MKYEDLEKVNKELTGIDVKGKEYVEVNKRVLAFRKLYPEGTIETEILSLENERVVIKAIVKNENLVLATGIAYEKENSTFINKTSYIENCETSAVGRALGFLGIGIETSIASKEEVETAILNQEKQEDQDNTINKLIESSLRERISNLGISNEEVIKALAKFNHTKLAELKFSEVPDFEKALH